MKPLIVGESNPYQKTYVAAMQFAMYPEPRHASGGRLCFDIMGLDERTYLRAFDRTDLCFQRWSLPAARRGAELIISARTRHDVIVLCGAKVATAFGVEYRPFMTHRRNRAPQLIVLPHPSGRNRAWHAPNAIASGRNVLRQAGLLSFCRCHGAKGDPIHEPRAHDDCAPECQHHSFVPAPAELESKRCARR